VSQTKRAKATEPTFDLKPFSLNQEDLPPGYMGHNPAALFDILSARVQSQRKGEFESTIDHKARIERITTRPIIGSLKANSLIALSVPSLDDQLTSKYDADLTVLDIRLNWKKRGEFGVNAYLVVDKKLGKVASYIELRSYDADD
jgi:hypothetical protein